MYIYIYTYTAKHVFSVQAFSKYLENTYMHVYIYIYRYKYTYKICMYVYSVKEPPPHHPVPSKPPAHPPPHPSRFPRPPAYNLQSTDLCAPWVGMFPLILTVLDLGFWYPL